MAEDVFPPEESAGVGFDQRAGSADEDEGFELSDDVRAVLAVVRVIGTRAALERLLMSRRTYRKMRAWYGDES